MKRFYNYIPSNRLRHLLYTLGAVAVLCIIFEIGVMFGLHHPPRWDFRGMPSRYNSIGREHASSSEMGFGRFGFPHKAMPPSAPDFIGTVTDASMPKITAQSRDGDFVSINISSTTIIRSDILCTNNLSAKTKNAGDAIINGATIVVIGGVATDTTINAKFIRILTVPRTSQ